MELKEELTGLAGMLRPFKKFLKAAGLNEDDQVIFYGCPGTCTPFIELLSYTARDMPLKFIYVPLLDEKKARKITEIPDMGMQITEAAPELNPAVVILMGGLAMPGVPVSAMMAKETIADYKTDLVGICFMSMFEKAGWLDEIEFDLLIDATIDPVQIWERQIRQA